MKKYVMFLFFVSGILLAQDYEKAVKEQNDLIVKYALANDVEGQVSLYAEDAISLPSYSPMLMGHEELREAAEASKDMGVKFNKFSLTSVKILNAGDYVINIGTYELNMELEGMPEGWDDYGKYITIFRKMDDGSLKIYADTWNSDINPWETMQEIEYEDNSETIEEQ